MIFNPDTRLKTFHEYLPVDSFISWRIYTIKSPSAKLTLGGAYDGKSLRLKRDTASAKVVQPVVPRRLRNPSQ